MLRLTSKLEREVFSGYINLANKPKVEVRNHLHNFLSAVNKANNAKQNYAQHLRSRQTKAEWAVWKAMKQLNMTSMKDGGIKFRRQHALLGYIADFYCASALLVVEVDGEYHASDKQRKHDHMRTMHLNAAGIYVVRLSNKVCLNSTKLMKRLRFIKRLALMRHEILTSESNKAPWIQMQDRYMKFGFLSYIENGFKLKSEVEHEKKKKAKRG